MNTGRELLWILRGTDESLILDTSPDGFDESMITFERSEKYFGVFKSWTMPLQFVKEAAALLRNEFYTYGMASDVELEVQKLSKTTDDYSIIYKGQLDFATWKDTSHYVEVSFKDYGSAKMLKDYGGTEYQVGNGEKIYGGEYSQDVEWEVSGGSTYYGVDLLTLAKSLVDKMSDGSVYNLTPTLFVQSDFLTNVTYKEQTDQKIILVPGKQLRYPDSGDTVGEFRTSFDDWFKSVNALFNLGLGIETDVTTGYDIIRIEPKSYFFDTGITEDFGTVKNCTISMATKFMFKKLKIGYEPKEYNNIGDDWRTLEINASSKWEVKNEFSGQELDLVSKYRGDGYGIQDIIIDLSANGNADQEIFFMQIYEDTGTWYLDDRGRGRRANSPGTEFTLWNSLITPRRNLQRFTGEAGNDYKWLGNFFFGTGLGDLTFTSGDNSIQFQQSSMDGTNWLLESDEWTIIPNPIFFPILFEIETAMPATLLNDILARPYGLYEFTFENYTYRGHIMKIDVKVSGRSAQKVTILADGSVTIGQLIDRKDRP